jgi:large subunit ribosomal protein L4
MNKKERRLALFSLLSSRATTSQVRVLESIATTTIKTKDLLGVMSNMGLKSAVLAVLPTDAAAFQAGRNIPNLKVIGANYLNPHDILKFKDIVFTKESLAFVSSHFGN